MNQLNGHAEGLPSMKPYRRTLLRLGGALLACTLALVLAATAANAEDSVEQTQRPHPITERKAPGNLDIPLPRDLPGKDDLLRGTDFLGFHVLGDDPGGDEITSWKDWEPEDPSVDDGNDGFVGGCTGLGQCDVPIQINEFQITP